MKPAAAFAVGLWVGALAMAGVAAFNWRAWQRAHAGPVPQVSAELQAKDEELQRLRQQTATLSVEVQQLRRSVLESKSNLTAQVNSDAGRLVRRIPFRRVPAADAPAPQQWIVEAVVSGAEPAGQRLEAAAVNNDEVALEALALLADRDGGAALLRVWNADSLSDSNRVKVTRYVAATVEVNPQGAEWLRALFANPNTDRRLLLAALHGLVNPAFPAVLPQLDQRILPPPHFEPDGAGRLRLFDGLRATITDERLREPLERLRAQLAAP